jgi:putative SOS response-associated peptidase YedK
VVTTCAVVTCAANELMAELHDRVPVILDPANHDAWSDPSDARRVALRRPGPAAWLEAVPVRTRVDSPGNDDRFLIQPEGEALKTQAKMP